MHGLPNNIDLTFLKGKRLLQICVGVHEVIINFDHGVSITAECRIRVDSAAGASRDYNEAPHAAAGLFELLQCSIDTVEGRPNGELILTFDNSSVVHLFDDDAQYESYMIRDRDKLIVV